jgi:ankyrin repeat protein
MSQNLCSGLSSKEPATTPLHLAAKNSDMNALKKLLKNRDDLNRVNIWGLTPLYFSVQNGDLEAVRFLLGKGACANIQTARGGHSPLHYSASLGYSGISALLIKYGTDINMRNAYDYTPLHEAVKSSHTETVKLLLKERAEPNARTNRGTTPLHWSVFNGQIDITEILIKNGADPAIKDNDRHTPVDIAVSKKRKEILRILESALKRSSSSR